MKLYIRTFTNNKLKTNIHFKFNVEFCTFKRFKTTDYDEQKVSRCYRKG